ncbi:MAG: hypothetical protein LBM66_00205 [Bifidobacteriaceae bacterium]|jgi:hypothetical protein|nr:hypothetical protein [Bifidobacteriaceae bacterium]
MARRTQPTIQATVRADGTGLVSIDGDAVAVKAADMAQAGRRAVALAADRAAAAGHPLPLTAHSPEGTRHLTVHPDGHLTEGGPPRRKRPMAVLAAVVAAGLVLGGAGALAAFRDRPTGDSVGPGTGTAATQRAPTPPPPSAGGETNAPTAAVPVPATTAEPDAPDAGDPPTSAIPPAREEAAAEPPAPATVTPTATATARPGRRATAKPVRPSSAPRPPAAPTPTRRPGGQAPPPSGFYWN